MRSEGASRYSRITGNIDAAHFRVGKGLALIQPQPRIKQDAVTNESRRCQIPEESQRWLTLRRDGML